MFRDAPNNNAETAMQHALTSRTPVPSILPFVASAVELIDTPEGPAHYRLRLGVLTPAGTLGVDLIVDALDPSDYGLVLSDGTSVTCGELVSAYGSGSVGERDATCAMLDVLAAFTHADHDGAQSFIAAIDSTTGHVREALAISAAVVVQAVHNLDEDAAK